MSKHPWLLAWVPLLVVCSGVAPAHGGPPKTESPPKDFKVDKNALGAWSPDCKWLATLSSRGQPKKQGADYVLFSTVKIWNARTGALQHSLGELKHMGFTESFRFFTFSPDSATLAISMYSPRDKGQGMRIELWDVAKAALRRTIEIEDHRGWLSFAFSPDGKHLATLYNRTDGKLCLGARVFDVAKGRLLHTWWMEDQNTTLSVRYSNDGKTLATAGYTGKVVLWDTKTGESTKTLTGPKTFQPSLAFSPDDKTVAAGSSGLQLWKIADGDCDELAKGDTSLGRIAFHPSGKALAAIVRTSRKPPESELQLWSLPKREILAKWSDGSVSNFAITPDGHTLAVLHSTGEVRHHDITQFIDAKGKQ